jgi:hypothetical protein
MTKSALVKIGVTSERAQGMRFTRSVRQLLDQHEAAMARLDAAFRERLREVVAPNVDETEEPSPAAANG